MSGEPSDGHPPSAPDVNGWAAPIGGVVETVVATEGPDGRWNQAALGLSPPGSGPERIDRESELAATAWSYGRTRTRRNFERTGEGYVQFTVDPLDFVEAALGDYETEAPILENTVAWTHVTATVAEYTEESGTEIVEWPLTPAESRVEREAIPTLQRGAAAVVEATVPASRLDVAAYDEADLLRQLQWCAEIVEATGDKRVRTAFARIDDLVSWRERLD